MRHAIIGTVLLAALSVGLIFQAPSAVADDSVNPFLALWDAIFNLQSKDEDLQNQIDELRAGQRAQIAQEQELVSDLYTEIQVEATEDDHTLVYVKAGNAGQDRADEVKLTAFYLMPLFEINSIDSNSCQAKSRGIIECSLGTLESGQGITITIDATARESGEENTWTVDISSSTEDSDFSNNHITYDFETGSDAQVVQDIGPDNIDTLEPEQSSEPASGTEAPQESSDDPATNGTSSENPVSDDAEESSSSTAENPEASEQATEPQEESTEPAAPAEEQTQDQDTSEENGSDESPEQDTNSESIGNEDTEQATQEEPSEEQDESSEQSSSASEESSSP
jgi:hypothetical protein